MTSADLQK
jgi:hypothetical protein